VRLLRVALITMGGSPIPAGKELHASFGEIEVETRETRSGDQPGPALVIASTGLSEWPLLNGAHEVVVEEGMRKRLEGAIVLTADLMSVATRTSRSISSPAPWVAFDEVGAKDRAYLADAISFESQKLVSRHKIVLPLALDDPALLELPGDRADGLAIVAEGLASSHETGRFHEFARLFERAFALGPGDLVKPLSEFLSGATPLGYTEAEVRNWLTVLRHLATHADRRPEFATASDINPVLARVEQAVIDVLFNKELWRNRSPARRNTYRWLCGITPAAGLITQGTQPSIVSQLFDGYGTFPLHLGAGFWTPPAHWWLGKMGDPPETAGDPAPVATDRPTRDRDHP
jgi:hypothetical protein